MYRLARSHDPASMRAVGERVYSQMAAAGYGAVGEFHYVVHQPDGTPYEEPNAMAIALAEAAVVVRPRDRAAAGRLPPRRRGPRAPTPASGGSAIPTWTRSWRGPMPCARGRPTVTGCTSASPCTASAPCRPTGSRRSRLRRARAASSATSTHREQRRELAECDAEHGCSPIELLERCGFLGPRTSVVHAIHVSDRDVELLAASGSIVVTCPTTEGNLGDGYLPGLRYRDAGVRLAIGTDSQVRIDPFEELREMETLARRERQTRFALLAAAGGDLWGQTAANGRASLGLDGPGTEIEIDLDSPELAGVAEQDLALALATCASSAVVRR